jgi:hypothetical protein
MQCLGPGITVLAVTAIYGVWRAYAREQIRHAQNLSERVAYMLWVMVNQAG